MASGDSTRGSTGRKHLWLVHRDNYRARLLSKGWHMRGAFAEKVIGGNVVVQKIIETREDSFLCCFQRKKDFWAESRGRG